MNGSFDPREYLKGKWFKADEITQPVVLTINRAYLEKFQSGETKPVLDFLEVDQSLVLNKTRVGQCITLLGIDTNAWAGQRIMLAPGVVMGQRTIMIQAAPPPQAPTINGQAAPMQTTTPAQQPAMNGQAAPMQQPAGVQTNGQGEIVFQQQ